MRAFVLALLCLSGCLHDNLNACGTKLCPIDRACAPDGTCVEPIRLEVCSGLPDDTDCMYDDLVGRCHAGVCDARSCGDAQVDAPEQCDGTNLGGGTCLTYGFYSPAGLACNSDCSVDTTACVGRCGDEIKNGPELCDTTPGDVFTCYEVGFDYGSVRCSPQLCAPVYDDCVRIGWKQGQQNGDYTPGAYAPRVGDVYIVNGGQNGSNYLHVTGVSRVRVPTPDGCGGFGAGIWASSSDEVFLPTTNQVCEHVGTTWTIWPMPPGVSVQQVWGTAGNDVFAVGTDVMHFDGTTWSVVDTGAPAGTTFTAIVGRAGGKIVIGTSDGGVVIHDQGWTYEVVHAGTSIAHVWMSPNGTIYATSNGVLYTNKSGVWSGSIPSPMTAVNGVWGVSDSSVYLYGESATAYSGVWFFDGQTTIDIGKTELFSYFGGGPDNLLAVEVYSHYYESSGYFYTPIAPIGRMNALWAFSRSNIIAVDSTSLWRFDGVDWSQSTPFPFGTNLSALWAAGPNAIVGVGGNGATVTFDGTNWTTSSVASTVTLSQVWGEAANRVFASGFGFAQSGLVGYIFYFDGSSWQQVYSLNLDFAGNLTGFWGSADAGTYAIELYGDKMLHLAPGAAPTDWTEITLPDVDAVGVWGVNNQVVVAFSDGRAFSLENGTWTEIPARSLAAAGGLTGPAGDVFGTTAQDLLVHWDGQVWDRVRAPPDFINESVRSVFSGNGIVAVGNGTGVSLLVRP